MFVFLNQSLLNRFMYGGPNLVTAKKPHRTKINSWFSLFERNVSILSFLTLFVAENVSMPLSKTIKVAGRLVSLSVTLPFKLGKLDHRNQQWNSYKTLQVTGIWGIILFTTPDHYHEYQIFMIIRCHSKQGHERKHNSIQT